MDGVFTRQRQYIDGFPVANQAFFVGTNVLDIIRFPSEFPDGFRARPRIRHTRLNFQSVKSRLYSEDKFAQTAIKPTCRTRNPTHRSVTRGVFVFRSDIHIADGVRLDPAIGIFRIVARNRLKRVIRKIGAPQLAVRHYLKRHAVIINRAVFNQTFFKVRNSAYFVVAFIKTRRALHVPEIAFQFPLHGVHHRFQGFLVAYIGKHRLRLRIKKSPFVAAYYLVVVVYAVNEFISFKAVPHDGKAQLLLFFIEFSNFICRTRF